MRRLTKLTSYPYYPTRRHKLPISISPFHGNPPGPASGRLMVHMSYLRSEARHLNHKHMHQTKKTPPPTRRRPRNSVILKNKHLTIHHPYTPKTRYTALHHTRPRMKRNNNQSRRTYHCPTSGNIRPTHPPRLPSHNSNPDRRNTSNPASPYNHLAPWSVV